MTVSAEGRDAVDMDTKFGSASRIRRGALFASYYVIYHSQRVWTWVQTLPWVIYSRAQQYSTLLISLRVPESGNGYEYYFIAPWDQYPFAFGNTTVTPHITV